MAWFASSLLPVEFKAAFLFLESLVVQTRQPNRYFECDLPRLAESAFRLNQSSGKSYGNETPEGHPQVDHNLDDPS